jgi:hypothetical protein
MTDYPSIHPSIQMRNFFACLFGFDITVILNTSIYSHGLDWGNRRNIRVHMAFLIRIQNLVRSDSKKSVQKIQIQFITISILSQLFEYGSAQPLLALPTKARILCFRFIIEYSSIMDFGPYVIALFLCEDF